MLIGCLQTQLAKVPVFSRRHGYSRFSLLFELARQFLSYAWKQCDGSLPVTVWCHVLLLTTPRRWAAWCAEPDLRLESPGRRYRRGSSWLCDRDGSIRIRSASLVSLGWCIRRGTRGEGDGDADYLPTVPQSSATRLLHCRWYVIRTRLRNQLLRCVKSLLYSWKPHSWF